MLVEDVAHVLKKWPALKKKCAAQQPEPPYRLLDLDAISKLEIFSR